ncbi:MAG: putative acyl esterase, partial [Glaciecola sp.]
AASQEGMRDPAPDDTEYFEEYFPMGDGLTTLHADVMRGAGIGFDVPQPVILTVSPYTDHAGSTTSTGGTGPNNRFYDFLELTDLFNEGYTYVMVDLPGFGGSSGCNDWGGPREQMAVKAAVDWVAAQGWSTGKVGMMGKSYDAWTGLMGMAQDPDGLAAVVAMEPVYSGYRYGYTNGVKFSTTAATIAGFQVYDAKPGPTGEVEYTVNGATNGYCYAENIGLSLQDSEDADYWAQRNLLVHAAGSDIPLFLTQGFLETNTKPDGAFDLFNSVTNPDNRAWFGQFDHVRGWETQGEDMYATGQSTFVAQMMDFFDFHVKGVAAADAPTQLAAAVEVQDNFGRYRAEASWPPADMTPLATDLNLGSYDDDNGNRGSGNGGNGVWSISQELPYDVWMAGEPDFQLTVNAVPRANLVVNVYDIDPSGRATMVSRGATLLRDAGEQQVTVRGYGQDWLVEAGHRIGVLISSSNSEWWLHIPTQTPVDVLAARVLLPFLTDARTDFFADADTTPRLEGHLASAFISVPADVIASGEAAFTLPAAMTK